jgi:hypothetical protein
MPNDEERRVKETVDYKARHDIESHVDVCGERFEALKRKFNDMNLEIRDLRMDHKALSVKLDKFMNLVFLSTIALAFTLAMAFGAAAWQSRDRFTAQDAKEMKRELQRDIARSKQ